MTETIGKTEIRAWTYEEAISATGVGRFHYYLLATCGFALMAMATEVPGMSIIILAAKCDLNFSLQQQGLLASSGYFGIVLSCQFMGYLADKYGRVKIMRTSMMIALTCSLCSVFSVNTLMLIVLRFLTGIFIAGNQVGFTLIAEYHGNVSRSKHLTYLSTFLVMGSFYFR
uniref:Major facilitator superfamily (MFS) profile domain-containing protein n=1 Tax=Megaselia scalaris TaxID=36166 RepID=T1GYU1_MEGSC